jgi:hypothetical protein
MSRLILAAVLAVLQSLFPYIPAASLSLPHLPYRTLTTAYLFLTYILLPLAQTLLSIGHLLILLRLTGSFGTFKSGFRHRLRDWPIVKYFNCVWYISWVVSRGNVYIECGLLFGAWLVVYWVFTAGVNVVRAVVWWGMGVTQIKEKKHTSVSHMNLDGAIERRMKELGMGSADGRF